MDPKALARLVEQAKEDPEFFHNLVFDPENTLKELDYLDREQKAALISISPEAIISVLIGDVSYCGHTCSSSCGYTCGPSSCGYTTNLQQAQIGLGRIRFGGVFGGRVNYCGHTCSSSCGATCGNSCGHTTNLQDPGGFGFIR